MRDMKTCPEARRLLLAAIAERRREPSFIDRVGLRAPEERSADDAHRLWQERIARQARELAKK